MAGENVRFITFLGENRWRNNVQILNFPNIHFIDPYLRVHRVDWWFHVIKKGVAIMHRPDRRMYKAKVRWIRAGEVDFAKESGPLWQSYLAWKQSETSRLLEEDEAKSQGRTPAPEEPDYRRALDRVAQAARREQGLLG